MIFAKRCKKCGEEKSLILFPPHPRGSGGVAGTCRECTNARKRDERRTLKEKDPAAYQEKMRRYSNAEMAKPGAREKKREKNRSRYWSDEQFRLERIAAEKIRRVEKADQISTSRKTKYLEDSNFRDSQLAYVREWKRKKMADSAYRDWVNAKARHYYAVRRENEEFESFMDRMEKEAAEWEAAKNGESIEESHDETACSADH